MTWSTFLSTFGLIFVAELGDKTQLAVMTQTCKFRKPWPVLTGSSLALIMVTAIGTTGGRFLGAVIPTHIIRYLAASAFIVMGALIWRETLAAPEADDCDALENADCGLREQGWDWKAFGASFSLLFIAELGDKTQLAVLSLASKTSSPWIVFGGGAVALTAVTALGVVGGQQLCQWVPQQLLLRISAAAFAIMGILLAVGTL